MEEIHFPSWEELKKEDMEKLKIDFGATNSLALDEKMHDTLLRENLRYEDGELVDKLPDEPKTSEIKAVVDYQENELKELSKENREDILKEILLRLDELEDKEEE